MNSTPSRHILREIRLYAQWTQAQMAEQLGIRATYLSDLETGKRPVGLSILRKYAQVLQLPLSSLIFFMEEAEDGFQPSNGYLQAKALDFLEWRRKRAGIEDPDSAARLEVGSADDQSSE